MSNNLELHHAGQSWYTTSGHLLKAIWQMWRSPKKKIPQDQNNVKVNDVKVINTIQWWLLRNTQPIPCPVTGGLWVHGINWQGTRWKESCAAPCSRVCRQGQACGSSALVAMCCGRCSACRTRLHTSSSETATMHSAGVNERRSETNGMFINES